LGCSPISPHSEVAEIGPLVAVGPLIAALSGAAVGGATGGIIGGLIGLGHAGSKVRHWRRTRARNAGQILISVHSDARKARSYARRILERAGARLDGARVRI
jgi:hypothetical protein